LKDRERSAREHSPAANAPDSGPTAARAADTPRKDF
jgi:hypothetical protein